MPNPESSLVKKRNEQQAKLSTILLGFSPNRIYFFNDEESAIAEVKAYHSEEGMSSRFGQHHQSGKPFMAVWENEGKKMFAVKLHDVSFVVAYASGKTVFTSFTDKRNPNKQMPIYSKAAGYLLEIFDEVLKN